MRAPTWIDLLDALYADSWNPSLGRFRLPFAFRGHPRAVDDLSSSLLRLAAGRPDVARLELHLLRNFRKYAYGQAGTDTVWHWLALGQHRGLPTRLRLTDTVGNVKLTDILQWPTSPATKPIPLNVQFAPACSL